MQSAAINGHVYELKTTEVGTFADGQSQRVIPVEAIDAGSGFNLAPGYYAILPVPVPGIVQVVNAENWLTQPGADAEPNDQLQLRTRNQFSAVTGRDLNLVVGQKLNATVGGDMVERIQGLRESVAVASQKLTAPKTWIGSEGVNVLQVLADLIDLVGEMNAAIAVHVHGPSPPPDSAAAFVGFQGKAVVLGAKQKSITM